MEHLLITRKLSCIYSGILGCMWSETIRTADQMDFMLFPRLLALAERAWHKASWEDDNKMENIDKDWKSFATFVVKHELRRLEKLGIKYRIPLPGIRSKNLKTSY